MFDFKANAQMWYPTYLTADNLKVWVVAGVLSAVDFKDITGQDYTA